MKSNDLFAVHTSSKRLNESLQKTFGKKLNLETFNLDQLQDARNKIRTQLSQVRNDSGFNENLENDAYHQAKFMLDALNAEILEREEFIADPHVAEVTEEGDDASFDMNDDSQSLRSVILEILEQIHEGSLAGENMIDLIADELGSYFDEVESSDDEELKQAYALMREEGQELEGDPEQMAMVAQQAIGMLNQPDVEEIDNGGEQQDEYFHFDAPQKDRGPRDNGRGDELARREKTLGKGGLGKGKPFGREYKEKDKYGDQYKIAGPKGKLPEEAPPGAKAERMVKHIKKGYAKDGKLTDKEKSIAYATAWKQHNKEKNESIESGEDMTQLREGEIQQASAIVTAKTMVDRVGRWIEELSGMENDTLLQLGDSIRDEMSAEQAKTFISTVAPAIQQALQNLKDTRETLATGVRTLTGEEQAAGMLGAEAPGAAPAPGMGGDEFGPAEPDMMNAEPAGDEFGAADAAVGGVEAAGREQRESIQYQNRLLKVLAG